MQYDTIEQAIQVTIQYYQHARLDDAEMLCKEILASDPHRVEALNIAGLLAIARDEHESAERYFKQALRVNSESEYSWNNLGIALYNQDRFAEAVECFEKTLRYNPNNPSALNNLGESLNNLGRHDEALKHCQKAVALAPQSAEAQQTLGVTLSCMGKFEEALARHRQAVALDPQNSKGKTYYATTLLLLGQFSEGWKEYEYRQSETWETLVAEHRTQPIWNGQPIEGKTLLVHAEQGLGDNIQFVRYLPIILERGAHVIYVCRPEMRKLLTALENTQLVSRGEKLPAFDLQCRIMSLPHLLGTTMDNIPNVVPYLKADETKIRVWKKRMPIGLNVGIVWAGNPRHSNDKRRSIPFTMLAPLLDTQGVTFFSLQKGPASRQAGSRAANVQWMNAEPELTDLSDTAALITNLDLVLTVDTAVAHLAGALGKPVWTMISHVPDFRWLLKRTDSPWYPTMRLFRQAKPDEWQPVVAEVTAALADLAKQ